MAVPGADRIQHLLMGLDGLLHQLPPGNVNEIRNRLVDNGDQRVNHAVPGTPRQHGVKLHVAFHVVFSPADHRSHLIAGLLHLVHLLLRSLLRGNGRNVRLDHQPDLAQIQTQLQLVRREPESQRVVRHPGMFLHKGAVSPAHLQYVLADQGLDGFPDRASPHIQPLRQIVLSRQLIPGLKGSIHNHGNHLVRSPLRKGLILCI